MWQILKISMNLLNTYCVPFSGNSRFLKDTKEKQDCSLVSELKSCWGEATPLTMKWAEESSFPLALPCFGLGLYPSFAPSPQITAISPSCSPSLFVLLSRNHPSGIWQMRIADVSLQNMSPLFSKTFNGSLTLRRQNSNYLYVMHPPSKLDW